MRVTHVVKVAGIGGCERHLLELLPALAARGTRVDLVVLLAPGGERFVDAARDRGIDVHAIGAGWDADPRTVAQLFALLGRTSPDVVHTHLVHADVHGQLGARIAGRRGVMSIHSTHAFYRREPVRTAVRAAGRLARRTIAISEFAARYVREQRLAPSDRVRVVPYGVDALAFDGDARRACARHDFDLAPDDVAVVIASRLIPGKGHDALIEACRLARQQAPTVRLLIAGDGPRRDELAARVNHDGATMRMLGFVDDVPALFAAADIVAFTTEPTLSEGFGLAALEAQAAAKPVIATAVASLPEIVTDCETGILVAPGDVRALARAIEVLALSPAARQRLGAAARRRARAEFSVAAMADRTLSVYDEAVRPLTRDR
jgi:glycosyltransferase involved in cell wall biosynthesis